MQYAILSGRSPFLTHLPKDDSSLNIMKRIRSGDFRMDSTAWKHVSSPAKQLVRGLLTVDPKKRLNLDDLFNSSWIKLASTPAECSSVSQLLTPAVLNESVSGAERSILQTFNAFHRVTREGGLAHLRHSSGSRDPPSFYSSISQRSRCKQHNSSAASSSSGCSSLSSLSNSSSPTKQLLQPPWSSAFFAAAAAAASDNGGHNILNFRTSSRMNDYLNSLSQIQQSKSKKNNPPANPSSPSSHNSTAAVEALSGVSYRLLPPENSGGGSSIVGRCQLLPSKTSSSSSSPKPASGSSGVSITPLPLEYCQRLIAAAAAASAKNSSSSTVPGPMTRSRKRKLKAVDCYSGGGGKKRKNKQTAAVMSAAVSITAIKDDDDDCCNKANGSQYANPVSLAPAVIVGGPASCNPIKTVTITID